MDAWHAKHRDSIQPFALLTKDIIPHAVMFQAAMLARNQPPTSQRFARHGYRSLVHHPRGATAAWRTQDNAACSSATGKSKWATRFARCRHHRRRPRASSRLLCWTVLTIARMMHDAMHHRSRPHGLSDRRHQTCNRCRHGRRHRVRHRPATCLLSIQAAAA